MAQELPQVAPEFARGLVSPNRLLLKTTQYDPVQVATYLL
jgi:hypothetical protein